MLDTKTPVPVQGTKQISAEMALTIARERFSNLAANGILGKRATGAPIDPAHVTIALAFLSQCRKSKVPAVHSHDLCGEIGVSVGALICAAHALGFDVRSWMGTREFMPGAMIGVNSNVVRLIIKRKSNPARHPDDVWLDAQRAARLKASADYLRARSKSDTAK
jgi:hypothetical protein